MAKPTSIPEYLKSLDPGRRKALQELREWVKKALPSARETVHYGMPTYEGAEPICAIAAQKQYLALYVCELDALDRHRDDFAHLNVGKGCIRFKAFADLPRTAARRVLREAARDVARSARG